MIRRLVFVTGLSGSGKSSAARALEDEGFFVVDNLPLLLVPQLLACLGSENSVDRVAVVTDARHHSGLSQAGRILDEVRREWASPEILFIEANDDALMRRFSETRRRHPLASGADLSDGIARERELLENLKRQATLVLDSSFLTPHQLRAEVLNQVCSPGEKSPLTVLLQSFGFRYGVPPGSDLVMDVRFLPNPYFVPELQQEVGTAAAVQAYALENRAGEEFLGRFTDLLHYLLPQYRREGKSYLTLSIGCTGGRHRSVAVVETIAGRLDQPGMTFEVSHRDIARG